MWEAKENSGQGTLRGSQCQVAWLQTPSPSCLPPIDTVGFLAKQKQKSEDSDNREMKAVLWAEQVADLRLTSALESGVDVFVL